MAYKDFSLTASHMICAVGLGGFLIWAGFAPLAEGVTASGSIVVADNRKVVQHLEGGIVAELNIREGDIVAAGDILLTLETIAPQSARDELQTEIGILLASQDRLLSLLKVQPSITFSTLENSSLPTGRKLTDIKSQQKALFENQRLSHELNISVLQSKRSTLLARDSARSKLVSFLDETIAITREELQLKSRMERRRLITVDEVSRLQKELVGSESERQRLLAESDEVSAAALEISEQIRQVKADFSEELSRELNDIRSRLMAATERSRTAEDLLKRTTVTAPQGGEILNLRHHTIGGIIRPGDPILEIVPPQEKLTAKLRINPSDRDSVQKGLKVVVQLAAFKSWKAPAVDGKIESIGGDAKFDPDTGLTFYEAVVSMDGSKLEESIQRDVIPGMPVEAFVDSGYNRTFLDYAVEPIMSTLRRGL